MTVSSNGEEKQEIEASNRKESTLGKVEACKLEELCMQKQCDVLAHCSLLYVLVACAAIYYLQPGKTSMEIIMLLMYEINCLNVMCRYEM